MVDAEEFRKLRHRVEELEREVEFHRQCHADGHDAVLKLVEKVADLENRLREVQNRPVLHSTH